ncbi:protein PBDC1 [Brevipalpus obovatus]|uniref:protein PBDC1 n=1 Tax=Brevipalpus obovatus TaxID=246614 RepID=UPI003D9E7AB5
MSGVADILSRPADEFVNDPTIEQLWTIKAIEAMKIHYNLLCSVPPNQLRLTKKDDLIYKRFREEFPDIKVDKIDEDLMKSDQGKAKWRPFCEEFKDEVADYNFASLLRIDANNDYDNENTIIAPRIQFLAIEIARNREGCNDQLYNCNCKRVNESASQKVTESDEQKCD